MKITRPPKVAQSGSAAKASALAGAKGKVFASKLASAERGAGAASGAEKIANARNLSTVTEIGADLKAGKLTPQAALERVVEQVVNRQLGKAASPARRALLATMLRETLADDPLLAAKVRALGRE
jgi:hypothetical protein